MNAIQLVQAIGAEVCEECNSSADCGVAPEDCSRIFDSIVLLNTYIEEAKKRKLLKKKEKSKC